LEAPTVNQIEVCDLDTVFFTTGMLTSTFQLHPWCQQKDIVEYCKKNDIVVQAYCPIVRGEKWGHPALVGLSKKVRNLESNNPHISL
jgi:diketogulonate reductase-like aldo/keto reductase